MYWLHFKVQKRRVQTLTLRVYADDNLIVLQGLDTDDFEGCEFSKKFRAATSGDMKELICVEH